MTYGKIAQLIALHFPPDIDASDQQDNLVDMRQKKRDNPWGIYSSPQLDKEEV